MMHQSISPQGSPSSTCSLARRGATLAVLASGALALVACGGGVRQSWSFAPVQSGGVSLSTDAVVVRPQSVNVQVRVHNPTPNRVAINYRTVVLQLPNGSVVQPANTLAARMRVERSGGVGGIQYVPPGGGVFRVDYERGPVDYTTLPSMQLQLNAVLVTNVTEARDMREWSRAQSVDGVPLNFPPITITPPAGPPPPVHVVSSSAVVPATAAPAPSGT